MTMQRRHFELIARVIRESSLDDTAREKIAQEFASALRGTNAGFNASKFAEATRRNTTYKDRSR